MKKMSVSPAVAGNLAGNAVSGGNLEKEIIPLSRDVQIVAGVARTTIPEEKLFAEKGQKIELGALPWNMEKYTGKKSGGAMLLRVKFTAPEDGYYEFDCDADWWLSIWVDGNRLSDLRGVSFRTATAPKLGLKLKKGKHQIDLNFARGTDSAKLVLAVKKYAQAPFLGVDLDKTEGFVNKDLHGSNTTAVLYPRGLENWNYDEKLKKLNFTLSRNHDWALWNNGQRIIDWHFIFPLQHLDPKDPKNYYFAPSDEIMRLTQDVIKMETFYRLGTSIEHTGDIHFNALPPKDFDQCAEVFAGIIRHYTKGWADGYHYNIRYWEIWEEPDGPRNLWDGSYESFVKFFVTVLKRLKREFPDLLIGGPALCTPDEKRMTLLLDECRKAGVAPDFISWHCYSCYPSSLISEAVKVRQFLDEKGFAKTKISINEWHYLENWDVWRYKTPEEYLSAMETLQGINAAAYNTAVFSGWQYGPLDSAMWYGSSWGGDWGYENYFKQLNKNYYSMELLGRFIGKFTKKCRVQNFNSIFLLAGKNAKGDKAGLLVSDFKGGNKELRVPVKGIGKYKRISAVILDASRNLEAVKVDVVNGELVLKKAAPGSAVFYVILEK